MNKYQAVIIGFGKAGKTLAVTLAKAGWRVALIEQSNAMYGGTCINIGCIPTKTLVHDAQQHTDFVRAIQRKNEVVNFLRNKNFHNLADMPNIDVIDGQAEFINNHSCVFIGLREIWKFMARKFLLIPVHKPWFRQFLELPPRQEYMTAPDYLI